MYNLTLEFDNEPELRETTRCLLTVHGLTGEIGCRRLNDGRWRLEVISERKLGEGLLDSIKGRLVVSSAGSGSAAGDSSTTTS